MATRKKKSLKARINESAAAIRRKLGKLPVPETLVVLGSGFKDFADRIEVKCAIELGKIPNFAAPKVLGHGTGLLFGKAGGTPLCLMTGRIHMYEGHSAEDIVFYVRTMARLGVKRILLTNAAGSVDLDYKPGDVVVLKDHINFTGRNSLIGDALELGPVFVDMSECYNREWREKLKRIPGMKEGIYIGALGPSFETPAEVEMFRRLGGNLIGMSTVLETIAARQLGLEVAAISFVTNFAGGLGGKVDHHEVLDIGKRYAPRLADILTQALA